MARKKMTAREIIDASREEIVDSILQKMEDGGLAWVNDLEDYLSAKNYKTQADYRGINRLRLAVAAAYHGWNDSRFLTYKQAKSLGLHVREGEHGTMIEKYKEMPIRKKDESGQYSDELEGFVVVPVSYAYVFNMEQIEGEYTPFDEAQERTHADEGLQSIARKALEAAPCPVSICAGTGVAHYSHSNDMIGMFPQQSASTLNGWTRVLLHEESHATGNKKRLNRDVSGNKRSKTYAMEELVAEISAAFLAAELGLPKVTQLEGSERNHIDNHAAYVQGWLTALRNDKAAFFRAVGRAQKAADYIAKAWRPSCAPAQA